MKGEWIILLWALLGTVFLVKTTPVGGLVRRVRRQPPAVQATVALCLLIAVITGGTKPGGTNELSRSSMPVASAPENSSLIIQQSSMPSWWTHDATDTDDDGIPDLWEKWTHGNRQVADSGIDRDEDGLTDLEEFQNQTDPRTADTDGDGFDDAFEVGRGMNPLAQEDFTPVEPDENQNGVPDVWDVGGFSYGYVDSDGDGFDDNTRWRFPEAADWNYDVSAIVHTSRSALLVWSEMETEGVVLPPCTNFAVRLRLDARKDSRLRLLPAPGDGDVEGLWKARILVGWDTMRTQDTEMSRVRTGSGIIVDHDPGCSAAFIGLLGDPSPSSPSAARGAQVFSEGLRSEEYPSRLLTRPSIAIAGHGGRRCSIHGPTLVVTAAVHHVETPLLWTVSGNGDGVFGGLAFVPSDHGFGTDDITVEARQITDYARLIVFDAMRFTVGRCDPASTNIAGAAWSSSHNPEDAGDHLPVVEEHEQPRYALNCPLTTNITVRLGFAHTAPVNMRNLSYIPTDDPADSADHCLGVIWEPDGSIDLRSLLDPVCDPHLDALSFLVSGNIADGGLLEHGEEPGEFAPHVFHVELRHPSTSQPLDRLWVVIGSRKTKKGFDIWYSRHSSSLAWVAGLPKPYASLVYSTNAYGHVTAADPEPDAPYNWERPSSTEGNLLHHDAKVEMRSRTVSGGHGNQACYGADGKLIIRGIAGGTADYGAGNTMNVRTHVREDVLPFLRAVWLDGNPGKRTLLNNISRPCLHEGDTIDRYIQCRPITTP